MNEPAPRSSLSALPFFAVVPFLIIAFGLAWSRLGLYLVATVWVVSIFGEMSGSHPLFVLAVYSPAIAAILVVLAYSGITGVGSYLSRLLLWRTSLLWWAFLLLGIPAIYFAGALVKGNAMTAPLFVEPMAAMLPAIGFMMILGPVEELGWRGLALPLLQQKFAPVWAGLILGLIWGVWHLPAFFLSGTPQSAWGFTPFLVGSIAVSLILTPLFNRSGGSIALAMLFHFQLNNPLWPDAQPYDMIFFVAAAALIVLLNQEAMFRRGGGVSKVVPEREEQRPSAGGE